MNTQFVEAISTLFSAVIAVAVLVLGFVLARKFLRKGLGESASSSKSYWDTVEGGGGPGDTWMVHDAFGTREFSTHKQAKEYMGKNERRWNSGDRGAK